MNPLGFTVDAGSRFIKMRNFCGDYGFLNPLNHRIAHRRKTGNDIAYRSRGKRDPKDAAQNLVDAIYTNSSNRV